MRNSIPIIFVLAVWLPANAVMAYTITLSSEFEDSNVSVLRTKGSDGIDPVASEIENPVHLPFSQASTVDVGTGQNISTYDLTNEHFDIVFSHTEETGRLKSFALSSGSIFFRFDQDVGFVASGSYTAADAVGKPVFLQMGLVNLTAGSVVFHSRQLSRSTPNESFTLGLSEGDSENKSKGSLFGTLTAGDHYQLFYYVGITGTRGGSGSGATASGGLNLSFVPEPSTGVLMALGLVAMTASRRQRRAPIARLLHWPR